MLKVLLFASHQRTTDLSYHLDWYEALADDPRFVTDVVPTGTRLSTLAFNLWRRRHRRYDLVFYPYGFFYPNSKRRRRAIFQFFSDVTGTKVFFLENEYRYLNEKLAYALSLGADYITTQLPKDAGDRVYGPYLPEDRIISLPHALNPRVISELAPSMDGEREIDLDITGDPYPSYLGHQDRSELARYFSEKAKLNGLKAAVNVGRGQRMDRDSWIRHLFNCKGVLHHEAGSDFLETNDSTRNKIIEYERRHPEASFETIFASFFRDYSNGVSGRCTSSRHFEAIGTRTCQLMFPGRFNDILKADEHYIAVNRDFSNADDALRRFQDESYRRELVDRTYEYVMDAHTHRHRIDHLLSSVGAV